MTTSTFSIESDILQSFNTNLGDEMSSTFSDFGLLPPILEAIAAMGYEEPTPIQAEAIPFLLENQQDLIALAQTGNWENGGFFLPVFA